MFMLSGICTASGGDLDLSQNLSLQDRFSVFQLVDGDALVRTPSWIKLLALDMGRAPKFGWQWQAEQRRIEVGIGFSSLKPALHFDNCAVECQVSGTYPLVKGVVGFRYGESSIYLSGGIVPMKPMVASPIAAPGRVLDWTAGLAATYDVSSNLRIWAAYDHSAYGCGTLCGASPPNLGTFSDDRVRFGLSWWPWPFKKSRPKPPRDEKPNPLVGGPSNWEPTLEDETF